MNTGLVPEEFIMEAGYPDAEDIQTARHQAQVDHREPTLEYGIPSIFSFKREFVVF